MVLNDEQVIEVTLGAQGLLKGTKLGSTIICMSTINRSSIKTVAEHCMNSQVNLVDCPFTGGPARIPTGSLTLIAAAPPPLLASVSPVLEVIGHIVHAGDQPGYGQAVKHCNQLLVGATHAATMEVIVLARQLGLDPKLVSKVIASGIAGSDYFKFLTESVLDHTPSPGGLGQMCKDMSIVKKTTEEVQMPAYVASGAWQYFSKAEALGMQNREGADLIEVVEKAGFSDDDNKNDKI
jgi:3-hydroxyisobutyrate dehydrogenase